ncbi:hypothetical protein ACVR1G_07365 [Streptococcus dentasini]
MSYASEIEFHADAVDNWKKYISGFNWQERALRADMGLGEEDESGIYDRYYILEDDSVKKQKEAHGEK